MPEAVDSRPVSISGVTGAPEIDLKNALPTEEQVAASEEEGEEGEEAPKRKRSSESALKGELTKERNRRREAQSLATSNQHRLDAALAALEAATKAPEPDKPKRADFSDPDEYDVALEKYATDRAEKAAEIKVRQRLQAEAVEKQSKELTDNFREAIEKFTEDHADFEDVFTEDLPITIAMSHAIMSSDSPAELAYWLGQNPDEAKRISQMTDVRAVKELGRIEERLTTPARPASTAKPAPIKPVGARSGASGKDVGEMTMEEYAAHRQAQLRGNGASLSH